MADGFQDFMQHLLQKVGRRHKMKPVAKLAPEDIVRFQCLISQANAARQEVMRIESKLKAGRDRLWADMQDKYGLHGKNISFNEETGELVEVEIE